jgi:hypothetical protein
VLQVGDGGVDGALLPALVLSAGRIKNPETQRRQNES